MQIKNNQDRAEIAYRTVAKFSDLADLNDDEMDTKISYLLCNLQHLAAEQGVDFQECLERGSKNYETEAQQDSENNEQQKLFIITPYLFYFILYGEADSVLLKSYDCQLFDTSEDMYLAAAKLQNSDLDEVDGNVSLVKNIDGVWRNYDAHGNSQACFDYDKPYFTIEKWIATFEM